MPHIKVITRMMMMMMMMIIIIIIIIIKPMQYKLQNCWNV